MEGCNKIPSNKAHLQTVQNPHHKVSAQKSWSKLSNVASSSWIFPFARSFICLSYCLSASQATHILFPPWFHNNLEHERNCGSNKRFSVKIDKGMQSDQLSVYPESAVTETKHFQRQSGLFSSLSQKISFTIWLFLLLCRLFYIALPIFTQYGYILAKILRGVKLQHGSFKSCNTYRSIDWFIRSSLIPNPLPFPNQGCDLHKRDRIRGIVQIFMSRSSVAHFKEYVKHLKI